MTLRALIVAVALVASVSAAMAADMPEAAPPGVVTWQDDGDLSCGPFGTRPVDRVWKPGQTAYIVAKTCGHSASWLDRLLHQRRENILVYYNGGSWSRPDVRVMNVPYQAQLHH
ncbi:MAG TPA: hypothetical protein VHA70_04805 [Bauldia sp.]|nr:hypothetical protein [Bauldia sp.]